MFYPLIHRVSTIQGDAGILPSTVCTCINIYGWCCLWNTPKLVSKVLTLKIARNPYKIPCLFIPQLVPHLPHWKKNMRSTCLILGHSGASSTYFPTNWPHMSDKLATYFPYISACFPHVSHMLSPFPHMFFTNWCLIDTLAPLPSEPLTPLGPVGNSPNPGRQR